MILSVLDKHIQQAEERGDLKVASKLKRQALPFLKTQYQIIERERRWKAKMGEYIALGQVQGWLDGIAALVEEHVSNPDEANAILSGMKRLIG